MMSNVLNTDLSGKVAVVTGAGGVLCSAFAKVLARAGAKVALLDLNYDAADKFAQEIVEEGGVAKAYPCNVLDKDVCYAVAGAGGAEGHVPGLDGDDGAVVGDEPHPLIVDLDEICLVLSGQIPAREHTCDARN